MPRRKQSEKDDSTTSPRTRRRKAKTLGLGIKKVSNKEWWITDNGEEYGPYDDEREAKEDLFGLDDFYQYEDEDLFVTVDPPRRDV